MHCIVGAEDIPRSALVTENEFQLCTFRFHERFRPLTEDNCQWFPDSVRNKSSILGKFNLLY